MVENDQKEEILEKTTIPIHNSSKNQNLNQKNLQKQKSENLQISNLKTDPLPVKKVV